MFIVFHSGRCFPDRAHFFWVCSHRDVKSFRWFVRTIKEAEDAVIDLTQKNRESVGTKMFHMHIFVTSFKEANVDMAPPDVEDEDGDLAFWGRRRLLDERDNQNQQQDALAVTQYGASFTEWDLYSAIMQPKDGTVSMGHVHVHKGRPAWDEFFAIIAQVSRVCVCVCVVCVAERAVSSSADSLCDRSMLVVVHRDPQQAT